jgi:hypothetical protein
MEILIADSERLQEVGFSMPYFHHAYLPIAQMAVTFLRFHLISSHAHKRVGQIRNNSSAPLNLYSDMLTC